MLATMRARQHRTITTLGTLGMSAGLIAAVTGIPVATVARIIGGTR
jgi:DNA-directed RNA polymerase specialized sigma24 family protein